MSELTGKLLICDRCGITTFLEYTGKVDLDGGFTKVHNFENKPEGWIYQTIPYKSMPGVQLCDKCNKGFNELWEKYMRTGEAIKRQE